MVYKIPMDRKTLMQPNEITKQNLIYEMTSPPLD